MRFPFFGLVALLSPCLVLVVDAAEESDGGSAAVMDPRTGALKPPPIPDGHRFGVAHISPRYKPNGQLDADILVSGAQDAYHLGFRTIKVGLSSHVVNPDWKYYSLPSEMTASVTSIVELAQLEVYQRLFDLPFQTFFLAADAIGEGSWETLCAGPARPGQPAAPDLPLSEAAKRNIYDQVYDLSRYLLTRYRGSRKIFVLQNHEADWHTVPTTDPALTPSPTALRNTRTYLELRQKAVDDARLAVGATDVYLYHMCEVNLVKKALAGGRTVTNDVLPRVRLDLVGYSAYDTSLESRGEFLRALAHLRAKASDSYAFGDNNVVISEIGVPERIAPAKLEPAVRSLLEAVAMGVPWVLQWALYDNECVVPRGDGVNIPIDNAREDQCNGFRVRKPDGSLGQFFRSYQPYLTEQGLFEPEPTDPGEYVERLYLAAFGRAADPQGRSNAVELVRSRPWDKEALLKNFVTSPEYKQRTCNAAAAVVFDAHRILLGRNLEPAAVRQLARQFRSDADRVGYINAVLQSDEAQRRYVTWLYRRYLQTVPERDELESWVRALKRGRSRREVHDAVVARLTPTGRSTPLVRRPGARGSVVRNP